MPDKVRGTIKQYPYRTANVRDAFLRVPRDTVIDLEHQLAEASGARVDNHTVYEIVQHDDTTYVLFSDLTATFGHSVVEGRWP